MPTQLTSIPASSWIDDETLEFEGVRFCVTFDPKFHDIRSTVDRFLLVKDRQQLDQYLMLGANGPVERVVELGILQGGSAVFFERAFQPEKLVAIELGMPVPALDEYIRARDLGHRLKPYYGVNQADRAAVGSIVTREFRGKPLDLVIDDACHLLRETRESFNLLFPRLRPGGTYVIEDWGWAHWPGIWQTSDNPLAGHPALTNLIFQLCMTVASRADVVAQMSILPSMVVVRRGEAELDDQFDIAKSYAVLDPLTFTPLLGGIGDAVGNVARHIGQLATKRSSQLRRLAERTIRAARPS